jgi:hypothetical protein
MTDYDALNVNLPSPPAHDCGGDRLPNGGAVGCHHLSTHVVLQWSYDIKTRDG